MTRAKSIAKRCTEVGLSALAAISLSGFGNLATNANASHRIRRPRMTRHVRRHRGRRNRRRNARRNQNKHEINVPANSVAQQMPKSNQKVAQKQHNKTYKRVLKIAKSKLGDPYVWGGNGPRDFDCSGFTSYIYRNGAHKNLPRLAGDQFWQNKQVAPQNRKPGDLVFFGSSTNNIWHVGMYIGKGKMIDAQLRGVVVENVKAPWWHAVGYSRPLSK